MIQAFKKMWSKKNADIVSGDLGSILGRWGTANYKYDYAYADYLNVARNTYNSNPDIQEAIEKITNACSSFPLILKDHDGKEFDLPESVKDFMQNPSPDYTWKQFVKSCFISYYIGGEVILLNKPAKNSKDVRLFLVQPQELEEIRYSDGLRFSYKITEDFFKRLKLERSVMEGGIYETEIKMKGMPVNQVAYYNNLNPATHERGLSTIITLLNDIEVLIKGRLWNVSILKNEGRPSGVFHYDPKSPQALNPQASPKSKKKVESEITQRFSGATNAGKALVLGGGLQFQAAQMNPKEVDFIQGLYFARETIANRLGIPLQLFGSQKASTYNNMKEARLVFYSETCIPLMDSFLDFLCRQVLIPNKIVPQNLKISVDVSKSEVVTYERQILMADLKDIPFITPNEKREHIGLERATDENADSLIFNSSATPLKDLGMDEADGMEDEEDDTQGKPD